MKVQLPLLATLTLPAAAGTSPSISSWESLANSFGEKLVTDIRPPGAPCHQSSYNATECATVVAQWQSPAWRSDQIGSMQTITWEQLNGHWCDIALTDTGDPTNSTAPIAAPCAQGNVPRFGINATTPADVLQAVRFANKFSIPLVIKGTGHDYLGRSSDPNRLLIWTRYMNNITYGSSQICGTSYSDTLTVAAGVQWGEAYAALAPFQRVTPGGADPGVGASGGQPLGGGHSPLSNTYGLTPDSILQFEVVTLDGEMRTVNQCTNKDLFWALRGGGGGTYAIVTSTTYKTYADAPTAFALFDYENTPAGYAQGLDHLANYSTRLAEMGWSGYFYGVEGTFFGVFFLPLINNITFEAANSSFQPLFKALNDTEGLNATAVQLTEAPSAQSILSSLSTSSGTGGAADRAILGSRLIPKALLQEASTRTKLTNLIASLRNDTARMAVVGHLVAGGAVSKPTDSAVLPAWRKALWHLAFTVEPPVEATREELDQSFQLVTEKLEPLRHATPGSGAYMNEAHARLPEWKEDFFGENYGRLLELKKKWDPKQLLRCNECVGSDL